MSEPNPFVSTQSVECDGLTLQWDPGQMDIFGSLTIERTKAGLHTARQLLHILQGAVEHLAADPNLPDTAPTPHITTIANPFAT